MSKKSDGIDVSSGSSREDIKRGVNGGKVVNSEYKPLVQSSVYLGQVDGNRAPEVSKVFVGEEGSVDVKSEIESGEGRRCMGFKMTDRFDETKNRVVEMMSRDDGWGSWGVMDLVGKVLGGKFCMDDEVEDVKEFGTRNDINSIVADEVEDVMNFGTKQDRNSFEDWNAWKDEIGEPIFEDRRVINETVVSTDLDCGKSDCSREGADLSEKQHLNNDEQVPDGRLESEGLSNVNSTDMLLLSGCGQECATEKEGEYNVSDLVWGKVRCHPWWPGQIFAHSAASDKAMKHFKKDTYLIAYFGDHTFAWNEVSKIKPFWKHFSEMEKQSDAERFCCGVGYALDEVARRVELGLSCWCLPKEVLIKIKYQTIQNAGIKEESSIRDGGDCLLTAASFVPGEFLQVLKSLAEAPVSETDRLHFRITKAQFVAFNRWKSCYQLSSFEQYDGLLESDAQFTVEEGRNSQDLVIEVVSDSIDAVNVPSNKRKSSPQHGSSRKCKQVTSDERSNMKEKCIPVTTAFADLSLQNDLKFAGKSGMKTVSAGKKRGPINAISNAKRQKSKIKYQTIQNAGIKEESSIRDGGDCLSTAASFVPGEFLQFLKSLAEAPVSETDRLHFRITKAQFVAFSRWKGCYQLSSFEQYDGLLKNDAQFTVEEGRNSQDLVKEVLSDSIDAVKVPSNKRKSSPQDVSSRKCKQVSNDERSKMKEKCIPVTTASADLSLQNDLKFAGKSGMKTVSAGKKRGPINSLANAKRQKSKIKHQTIQSAGIKQESSIRDGGDCLSTAAPFVPGEFLQILKSLAEAPVSETDILHFRITKAQFVAFSRWKGCFQLSSFEQYDGLLESDVQFTVEEARNSQDLVIEVVSDPIDAVNFPSNKRKSSPQHGSSRKCKQVTSDERSNMKEKCIPVTTAFADLSLQNDLKFAGKSGMKTVSSGKKRGPINSISNAKRQKSKIKYQTIQSAASIRDGEDCLSTAASFVPGEFLQILKSLAEAPVSEIDRLDFRITKAQFVAFSRWKGCYQLSSFEQYGGLLESDAQFTVEEGRNSQDLVKEVISDSIDAVKVPSNKRISRTQDVSSRKCKQVSNDERSTMKEKPVSTASADLSLQNDLKFAGKSGKKTISACKKRGTSINSISNAKRQKSMSSPRPTDSCSSLAICSDDGSKLQRSARKSTMEEMIPSEFNPEEILLRLNSAAVNPRHGYCILTSLLGLLREIRNSTCLEKLHLQNLHNHSGKSDGKKSFSLEATDLQFEGTKDSYWTDRIIQGYSQEEVLFEPKRPIVKDASGVELEATTVRTATLDNQNQRDSVILDCDAENSSAQMNEGSSEYLPTALLLNFTNLDSIPSLMNLNEIFKRYGPLDETRTQILSKSKRAKVVFKRRADAEAAFSSTGKYSIFGSSLISYRLRYIARKARTASKGR